MTLSSSIDATNDALRSGHQADFENLAEHLTRRGQDIEALVKKVSQFGVAIPSWGVGTGGTRFARFPGLGEPRGILEKIEDCGVIQKLACATPRVSLHIPWDLTDDVATLTERAGAHGLTFDAMNSNTFQDQEDQELSYKFGSLSHTDAAVRDQAIAHNLACIEFGEKVGSSALTVWVGDGSNFPGQSHMARTFKRYLSAMEDVYAALPDDWNVFIEHKIYEPAFYSTVIQDWGSSLMAAQHLGDKAKCLVDLGHHAPTVNIEMIVARLAHVGKLGGFHFNDSKYGDDDLDAGAIDPYRLFLVFNELVDLELSDPNFAPAHMIDQSHNVTDPIESVMVSASEIRRSYAQALIVNRAVLDEAQDSNDALTASECLKSAFRTDVEPILAEARLRSGGAIDPIKAYRHSGYRDQVTAERPAVGGSSSGIV